MNSACECVDTTPPPALLAPVVGIPTPVLGTPSPVVGDGLDSHVGIPTQPVDANAGIPVAAARRRPDPHAHAYTTTPHHDLPVPIACEDTAGFDNGHGYGCAAYAE